MKKRKGNKRITKEVLQKNLAEANTLIGLFGLKVMAVEAHLAALRETLMLYVKTHCPDGGPALPTATNPFGGLQK